MGTSVVTFTVFTLLRGDFGGFPIELRTQSYGAFDALVASILTTAVAAVEPDECAVRLFCLLCFLCRLALEIAACMRNFGRVFL